MISEAICFNHQQQLLNLISQFGRLALKIENGRRSFVASAEYQLRKIAIFGDDHPLIANGQREQPIVRPAREIRRSTNRIVTALVQGTR